jgi:hypothetical protein
LARDYTQLTLQVAGKVYGTAPDGQREQISHTDPAVCMGLIEQHGIASTRKTFSLGHFWECRVLDVGSESHYTVAHGKTPAQAVARCIIAMRLGDEFEVPDELGVQS